MNANLAGTACGTAAAIAHCVWPESGAIVVLSSRVGRPQRSVHATGRWGLAGFERPLGPPGGPRNAVPPGAVAGDPIDARRMGRAGEAGAFVGDDTQTAFRTRSVQRFVKTETMAELAWCRIGAAARALAGRIIPIGGSARSSVRPR